MLLFDFNNNNNKYKFKEVVIKFDDNGTIVSIMYNII